MPNVAELLEEHNSLIESMAHKTLRKVKKPTILEFDDLVQEGTIACIKAIQSWDPNKGTQLSSWIHTILQNHLYDIVWYSYRKANLISVESITMFSGTSYSKHYERDFLEDIWSKFSFLEKKYIKFCLIEKMSDSKDFRERVRQILNISENVEDVLRSSIRQIISERN